MKAIIAKSGTMPPKIHTLVRLAELSKMSDLLNAEQKELLNELSPLNLEARYPSHKEQLMELLNAEYCEDLLSRTEGFLSWIQQQL